MPYDGGAPTGQLVVRSSQAWADRGPLVRCCLEAARERVLAFQEGVEAAWAGGRPDGSVSTSARQKKSMPSPAAQAGQATVYVQGAQLDVAEAVVGGDGSGVAMTQWWWGAEA